MEHLSMTKMNNRSIAVRRTRCTRCAIFVLSGFLTVLLLGIPATGQKGLTTGKTYTIGFALSLFEGKDVRDATAAVEVWAMELVKAEKARIGIKSALYTDLDDMVKAVKQQKIDMAVLSTLDYLAIRESCKIEPALVAAKTGKIGDDCALITHASSGIHSLADLKGKSIAHVNNSRGVIFKRWYNAELAKEAQGKAKSAVPMWKESIKDEQVAFSVFFKQVDAGLISMASFQTLSEMNPQIKRNVTVLRTSPRFVISLMCWASEMTETERQDLKGIALRMNKNPSGAQILKYFQQDKMLEFTSEYLESVIALDHQSKAPARKK
jgi:ABC-type phosphate/phosphonate transport system substrate-binding protein